MNDEKREELARKHHARYRSDQYAKLQQRKSMLRECEFSKAFLKAAVLIDSEKNFLRRKGIIGSQQFLEEYKKQRSQSLVPQSTRAESSSSVERGNSFESKNPPLQTSTSVSYTSNIDLSVKPTFNIGGSLPTSNSHAQLKKTDAAPSMPRLSLAQTPLSKHLDATLNLTDTSFTNKVSPLLTSTPIVSPTKPLFGPSASTSTDSGKFSLQGDKVDSEVSKKTETVTTPIVTNQNPGVGLFRTGKELNSVVNFSFKSSTTPQGNQNVSFTSPSTVESNSTFKTSSTLPGQAFSCKIGDGQNSNVSFTPQNRQECNQSFSFKSTIGSGGESKPSVFGTGYTMASGEVKPSVFTGMTTQSRLFGTVTTTASSTAGSKPVLFAATTTTSGTTTQPFSFGTTASSTAGGKPVLFSATTTKSQLFGTIDTTVSSTAGSKPVLFAATTTTSGTTTQPFSFGTTASSTAGSKPVLFSATTASGEIKSSVFGAPIMTSGTVTKPLLFSSNSTTMASGEGKSSLFTTTATQPQLFGTITTTTVSTAGSKPALFTTTTTQPQLFGTITTTASSAAGSKPALFTTTTTASGPICQSSLFTPTTTIPSGFPSFSNIPNALPDLTHYSEKQGFSFKPSSRINQPGSSTSSNTVKSQSFAQVSKMDENSQSSSSLPNAAKWIILMNKMHHQFKEKISNFVNDPNMTDLKKKIKFGTNDLIDRILQLYENDDELNTVFGKFLLNLKKIINGEIIEELEEKFSIDIKNEGQKLFFMKCLTKRILDMIKIDKLLIPNAVILHGIISKELVDYDKYFRCYVANHNYALQLTADTFIKVLSKSFKTLTDPNDRYSYIVRSRLEEKQVLKLFICVEKQKIVPQTKISELAGQRLLWEFCQAYNKLPQVPIASLTTMMVILKNAQDVFNNPSSPYYKQFASMMMTRLKDFLKEDVSKSLDEIIKKSGLEDIQAQIKQCHECARESTEQNLKAIGIP